MFENVYLLKEFKTSFVNRKIAKHSPWDRSCLPHIADDLCYRPAQPAISESFHNCKIFCNSPTSDNQLSLQNFFRTITKSYKRAQWYKIEWASTAATIAFVHSIVA